ncbi:hypothetical protein CBR_g15952 [Chara braunii]|uniref:Reverse transcriptase domain-containing protein n=1 Tax=Chara braunii TaxID=69332 RepID=A0A388JSN2_CHABU|nr:hypothetical protein CBR_g15952 [Chara braunii]|eukprot:GBG60829.1 hypothetical protein CBR_g15952 [Chara braunii]
MNSRDVDKHEVRRRRKVRRGRRERRGRSALTRVRETITGCYREGSFASLYNWLSDRGRMEEVHEVVTFSRGTIWIDSWKMIRRAFGDTRLLISGSRILLKHAKGKMQQGGTVTFLRIVKMKTTTEKNKHFLALLLKCPRPASQLANLTTNKLVGLYRAAGCFAEKKTKLALHWKIDSAIRKKIGTGVRRRINVKLRFDSGIRKKGVWRMVEQVVDGKIQDKVVAGFMKTKIRVVWLRNRTVGQVLHNQKMFAVEEESPCGCGTFSLLKTDGHVATRFAELPDVPTFLRNSKNITRSSKALNGDTLIQSVLDATKHIQGNAPKITVPEGTFAEGRRASTAWKDDEKRIARVLHYLLIRLPARSSFYLNFVADLRDGLETAERSLKAARCSQVVGRCYDIKEMLSRIPHEVVIQAVEQLLCMFEDGGWKTVKVSYRAKACVINTTRKKTDGYVNFTLQDLLRGVRFDLEHSGVRCRNKIMRQIFGIPMGKSTSPVLASITCAMAEVRFLKQLGADRVLIRGWRIMDDISIVVGVNRNMHDENHPEELLRLFERIYDVNLEVVRKDECGLTWQFVGGSIFLCNGPLRLYYIPLTKNTEPLTERGVLTFQTMQDFTSYSEKRVKKAV